MTPPKLTDEQMNEVFRKAFHLIDSRLVGDQIKFAHAIADLRDQQWIKMLAGQEPVAYRVRWPKVGGGHKWLMVDSPLMEKEGFVNQPLYTHPAPDQAEVMRQAQEQLELTKIYIEKSIQRALKNNAPPDSVRELRDDLQHHEAAIAALKQELGEQQ